MAKAFTLLTISAVVVAALMPAAYTYVALA